MNIIKQKYLERKICVYKRCRAVNSINSEKCVKCRSPLRMRKSKGLK